MSFGARSTITWRRAWTAKPIEAAALFAALEKALSAANERTEVRAA